MTLKVQALFWLHELLFLQVTNSLSRVQKSSFDYTVKNSCETFSLLLSLCLTLVSGPIMANQIKSRPLKSMGLKVLQPI